MVFEHFICLSTTESSTEYEIICHSKQNSRSILILYKLYHYNYTDWKTQQYKQEMAQMIGICVTFWKLKQDVKH
jgi:hypothetical protein